MVKRLSALLLVAAVLACACTPKPNVEPEPQKEDPIPGPEPPGPEPPGPEPPQPPADKDVTLMAAFKEEFSAQTSDFFDFTLNASRDDFRYYPGFPSLSESGNTILMLRLDTADPAGEGAQVVSKDYTHFGSYALRLRLPDVVSVQPGLTAMAELALTDDHPDWGFDEIVLGFSLADQKKVRQGIARREAGASGAPSYTGSEIQPELSTFNTAGKYYVYGLDWSADKIAWWFRVTPSGEKNILAETTENIPQQPLRLVFRYFSTKDQPALYPYELEIDWMQYTPSEP